MKYLEAYHRNRLLVLILLISGFILCSGCARKRPFELVRAEQELLSVADDTFVVQNSPVILEQAAKAYHRAERTWRETASERATVPLAILAQDLINDAKLEAGKNSTLDAVSMRARVQPEALILERRAGLGKFDAPKPQEGATAAPSAMRNDSQPAEVGESTAYDTQTVQSDIFFRPGDTSLSANGPLALDPLVSYLKLNPELTVKIEVHAVPSGDSEEDLRLTRAQAQAIRDYVEMKGVEPRRIKAIGWGGSRPLAVNSDPIVGRIENRRVTFTFIPV